MEIEIVVNCIIEHEGYVLLVLMFENGEARYGLPSAKQEFLEWPEATVTRMLMNQFGVTVRSLYCAKIVDFRRQSPGRHVIFRTYKVELADYPSPLIYGTTQSFKWIPRDFIPADLYSMHFPSLDGYIHSTEEFIDFDADKHPHNASCTLVHSKT